MILTVQKSDKEILKSLEGESAVFIIACAGCAVKSNTADKQSIEYISKLLSDNNIKISEIEILGSVCAKQKTQEILSKNTNFQKAKTILFLSCGTGIQAVGSFSDKRLIAVLNSQAITVVESSYSKFCSVCGDCILSYTQGICPKTRCPKSLVNGPCGGFVNGKCEIDSSKDCAWVLIYEKLKKNNGLDKFINSFIEPK
ncbi:MAG: methylenetetrahydrofolate reductase C-terminal domain-containing protein [Elusimicrobiota bacterium]|jgi:hypothetical protein|nr:methylenetetrahydrofolate reductase C-terminal domain-containing protein [Elusimicrobiota bacterium]